MTDCAKCTYLCAHLPLPGEPFQGPRLAEGQSPEQRGEGKERTEGKEDLHAGAPEIFTSESAQAFPVRHPDRFSAHRPDSAVPPAPQPPRRGRDHNWKQLGTTECSTTCGKGELMRGLAGSPQTPLRGVQAVPPLHEPGPSRAH